LKGAFWPTIFTLFHEAMVGRSTGFHDELFTNKGNTTLALLQPISKTFSTEPNRTDGALGVGQEVQFKLVT
jgi:hypothetical protein